MGLFGRKKPTAAAAQRIGRIIGDGSFTFEVVGESFHQRELANISGGKCFDGHRLPVTAELRADPQNKYDANCVEVRIDGQVVAHFSRDDAERFQPELLKIEAAGVRVLAQGLIVGEWDRGHGDEGSFGVKLDLDLDSEVTIDVQTEG